MSVHDGHRQRLKDRFLSQGLDGFTDVQVLEMLLFYCIPRQDTNVLAHRLLDRFGNLARVLDAPMEELVQVDGIKKNAATFLKIVPAAGRYYQVERGRMDTMPLTTTEACGAYMRSYFFGRTKETVYLLCLNAQCMPLACRIVGEGGINSTGVSLRAIVEIALAEGASTVVLAHNHPSGIALPSNEDIMTTRKVAAALDAVEVTLADHLVMVEDDFISMAQSGMYRPGSCVMCV